ncbi:MAG: ATP-grasp domain-containing protein [Desulfitobacteriaceae bacterium]|nr:ATP-grasp domain-containing protein [Desulfitobacteriaceae bacterium]MDD4752096.1 ATP-grasp domain-containing protein [Desulfitobacteriaceae bacterium]
MKLLILSTNADFYLMTLQCLIKSGMKENITIGNKDLGRFALSSKYCRGFYEVPDEDFSSFNPSIFHLIQELRRDHQFDVLLPLCLSAVYYVSKYQESLNDLVPLFPISSFPLIKRLHDKWDFWLLLNKIGAAAPKSFLMTGADDDLPECFSYAQLIAKPVEGEGSSGIIFEEESEKLFYRISREHKFPYIVQEYIPGYDVDLSILSIHGEVVAWTVQRQTDLGLEFINDEKIFALGQKIAKETGFHGIAHFDMRYDQRDGSVKVLECNPRVWFSMYFSCYAGVNFIKLGIDVLMKRGVKFSPLKKPILCFSKVSLKKLLFTSSVPFINKFLRVADVFYFFSKDPKFYYFKWFKKRKG